MDERLLEKMIPKRVPEDNVYAKVMPVPAPTGIGAVMPYTFHGKLFPNNAEAEETAARLLILNQEAGSWGWINGAAIAEMIQKELLSHMQREGFSMTTGVLQVGPDYVRRGMDYLVQQRLVIQFGRNGAGYYLITPDFAVRVMRILNPELENSGEIKLGEGDSF